VGTELSTTNEIKERRVEASCKRNSDTISELFIYNSLSCMHHVSTFNECSSCGALFQELKRRFIMRQPKPKKTSSRGKNNFFNRGKSVNAECSEVTVKIFAAKDLSLFYTILPETLAIRISTSLNPL
jgi:hypothetical protein